LETFECCQFAFLSSYFSRFTSTYLQWRVELHLNDSVLRGVDEEYTGYIGAHCFYAMLQRPTTSAVVEQETTHTGCSSCFFF